MPISSERERGVRVSERKTTNTMMLFPLLFLSRIVWSNNNNNKSVEGFIEVVVVVVVIV